jgi:hypothetical protein
MTAPLHEGRPLKEFAFQTLVSHQRAGNIAGWIYPRRDVSATIALFNTSRQLALNLWGWVAILIALAGVIVPIATSNWLWILLIILGIGIWRANRRSMEEFFLEQLVENETFFDKIASADMVKVILKTVR